MEEAKESFDFFWTRWEGVCYHRAKSEWGEAIDKGDEQSVAQLLAESPYLAVSNVGPRDTPSLHYASGKGYDKIVARLLVANPELIHSKTGHHHNATALHFAAYFGHDRVMTQLLSVANLRVIHAVFGNRGTTALHIAAQRGHNKISLALLTASPQLKHAIDSEGSTPLHYAAENGYSQIVAQMLARPLLDIRDRHGMTALHLAAESGHDQVVAQLLSVKSDVIYAVDAGGMTALHFAASRGHGDIVAQLLEKSPHLCDTVNFQGETVLHLAIIYGKSEIITQLLEVKPELINIRTLDDNTALHLAVLQADPRIATQVLTICQETQPSLITAVNRRGLTALHYAALEGNEPAVEMLLASKPELIFAIDKGGNTVLHLANGAACVERLWKLHPAALHVVNQEDLTPYDKAIDVCLENFDRTTVHMLAWSLSFDDLVLKWTVCVEKSWAEETLRPVMEMQQDVLCGPLGKDLAGIVCGYIGFSPSNFTIDEEIFPKIGNSKGEPWTATLHY